MRGRHAAEAVPSRPGLAFALLGALSLTPPALVLAPPLLQAYADEKPPVSRPDIVPSIAEPIVRPDPTAARHSLAPPRHPGQP